MYNPKKYILFVYFENPSPPREHRLHENRGLVLPCSSFNSHTLMSEWNILINMRPRCLASGITPSQLVNINSTRTEDAVQRRDVPSGRQGRRNLLCIHRMGWSWRDRTHTWDLMSNHGTQKVSVSSEWPGHEVPGSETGEISANQSGHGRLCGVEGLGHGRRSMN